MRTITRFAALSLACMFVAGRVHAQDVKLTEEKPGLIAKAKVAYSDALTTAKARIPAGKLYSAEIEQEDGKLIYTLVFRTPGKEGQDEINVSALTGKVVSVEHEKAPSEAKPKAPPAKKGGQ